MLRMYLLQVWFNLSDPGTEDAIYDSYAFPHLLWYGSVCKAPPYYETEESSMKSRKILSLLLTGAMK